MLGRRSLLPLAELELTATSVRAVTIVRLAAQFPQYARLASFQPRLATLPCQIVELARQVAIASGVGCLHRRGSVTLAITAREVRQLQRRLTTYVIRVITVQWAVQVRHSVLWVSTSLRRGVPPALRVRQVSTLMCLGALHFLTVSNAWLASMLLRLGVVQLVIALIARQGSIWT